MATERLESWIAMENVERFLQMLAQEKDPQRREMLEQLIAAQRAKLGEDPV